MKHSFFYVFMVLVSVIVCSTPAKSAEIGNTQITSKGACVMDYETGRVLYEYNGGSTLVPASMTKIMTMYCIYDAIDSGEITFDTVVPISANVSGLGSKDPGLTVIPLKADTQYTVDELINMIVVVSANDAALAIAELLDGTEQEFVSRMNSTAAELGLDAYFYDCYGLANNEISPVSMAELSRRIISDHPDILNRSSKAFVDFHGGKYLTTNHLLDKFYYSGADGLKTGTTLAAGCCFCGTAVRDNTRMIAVTMGSAGNDDRFTDAAKLLDYGFAAKKELFSNLYFTDIRTVIDGRQVPTLYHKGDMTSVIIAEDLENYGFDTSYDGEGTLTLTRNHEKKYSPIDLSYYRNKDGEAAHKILDNKKTKVILRDGAAEHEFSTVYSLDGYTGITTDELGVIYERNWIDQTSTVLINTLNKADSLLHAYTEDHSLIDFSQTPPMTSNGRCMLPARAAAEALGAEIGWDDTAAAYVISFNGYSTAITPNKKSFIKSYSGAAAEDTLSSPPQIINGSLYIAPEDIAYILGANVVFDSSTRTLLFRSCGYSPFLCDKKAAGTLLCAPLPDLLYS